MDKKILIFTLGIILLISQVSAVTMFSSSSSSARLVNTQSYPSVENLYSYSDLHQYWPILDRDGQCRARQDILLQIAPAGCQPTVVRSDLLEDQNVPVLCKIQAFQINPLIDVRTIDSITFSGRYPREVSTVGYYPARAGLSTGRSLTNSPVIDNAGYVVVVLRRNQNETSMPESVTLNLTARIRYDSYNALGVGQAQFILSEQTENEFQNASVKNSFWQGRYFVKADSIEANSATISLYYQDRKISTQTVQRGQQSSEIFIPGFSTCQASLRIAYDGFESSGSNRARIEVQDGNKKTDVFDVFDGSSFANGKCRVSGTINSNSDGTGSLAVTCSGEKTALSISKVVEAENLNEEGLTPSQKNYLIQARNTISEYLRVANTYPSENDGNNAYGEQALQRAGDLVLQSSLKAYLKEEYSQIISAYRTHYPSSASLQYYENTYEVNDDLDKANSMATFYVDNKHISVKVLNFVQANKKATASMSFGTGSSVSYESGKEIYLFAGDRERLSYKITITKIDPSGVTLRAACAGNSDDARTFAISERSAESICGQTVRVNGIDADKLARVRILPKIDNTQTETNLSVSIGIEKRAIQLSPERANEMIDNLNESIKKFDSLSQSLNTASKGLKTACFATAAVLTAKNFLSGLDGTSLARKEVMQGNDGWTARCTQAFKNPDTKIDGLVGGSYVSVDDCLRKNSDLIDKDVQVSRDIISKQNEYISNNIETSDIKTETKPFGTVVNTDESAKRYINYLKNEYGNDPIIGNTVKSLTPEAYERGDITYSQMKDLEYNALVARSGSGASAIQTKAAQNSINSLALDLNKSLETTKAVTDLAKKSGVGYAPQSWSTTNTEPRVYSGGIGASGISGVPQDQPVQVFVVDNVEYAASLESTSGKNTYRVTNLYRINGNSASLVTKNAENQKLFDSISGGFIKDDSSTYVNPYTNPKVKYFDSGSNKGMPAIVPVDTKEGWYAGVQEVLPSFGGQSNIQSSGRVSSFWICNVGSNGLEEFDKSGFGDDKCTLFNAYTGQEPRISGVDASKARTLVRRAEQLLTQAAQQYSSGVRQARIDGQTYKVENQISVPSVRCQDYMSPGECQLLFNVCDPVICPTSRCNFGGNYYVSNVPETGIVGSALLCLPNAKEGIAVPVCLTGLTAGVDGFVSVMKSHRDCLQEQLETGKTVGICDQIYSVYMCEYFWRQAAPLANTLIPKLVENAYGQGNKGGGEYLTVMDAWQQTQNSINYFTQEYAVNSIQAFKVRSVEEAGGEFCKAFASIKAPTSFDALIETDSPPQFNAWFSSSKYSDATVPATSQYKVYYHIFAGKDSGVSYQVYLKNPGAVSVVSVPQQLLIASDFIVRGQYASETRDFTAPEGYKELCVNVNGREECGFGQVSTSFAVNYLADKAKASVLTETGITSSSACVSGTVGQGITLNPNLQATAESALNPQIYEQGIIRVCATDNPGSTSAPGRYVKVGYCDSENVGCWLDSESVGRAITASNNGTLTSVVNTLESLEQANQEALLQQNGIVLTDNGFLDVKKSLSDRLSNSQENIQSKAPILLKAIDGNISIVFKQNQKAELQLLKGDVQRALLDSLIVSVGQAKEEDKSVPSTTQTTPTTTPELNNNPETTKDNVEEISSLPSSSETATNVVIGTGNAVMDNALNQVNNLREGYGENKVFIDGLYNDGKGLLTENEYIEINGKGATNFEEDMLYVHKILAQKAAKLLSGKENSISFSTASSNLNDIAYRSDREGGASQLYLNGLPMPVYVATYNEKMTIFTTNKLTPFTYAPIKIGEVIEGTGTFTLSLNGQATQTDYLGSDLYNLIKDKVIVLN